VGVSAQLTVIIPTAGRRAELFRAIASVQAIPAPGAIALVVVNGKEADTAIVDRLRRLPDVRLMLRREAGVSAARAAAVRGVDTPVFCLLDDDDELLPSALATVRAEMEDRADAAALNGYEEHAGGRRTPKFPPESFASSPVLSLLTHHWLSSGGLFVRTERVDPTVFDALPDYLELTYLGLRLACRYRVQRIDRPAFVYHLGAADRVSNGIKYLEEVPHVLRAMAKEFNDADVRRLLRRKEAAVWHSLAEREMLCGTLGAALGFHGRSVALAPGRYALFTARLIKGMLARSVRPWWSYR
jgi:glycosyltransferase involved in cell wall biosynthesis